MSQHEQTGYFAAYRAALAEHRRAFDSVEANGGVILDAGQRIVETLRSGRKLLICGNGGSAADAQHFAAEIVGRFAAKDRPALPAIAFTTDSSIMTSVSNDFGYEKVFARQVEALGVSGDLLVGITTSGTSSNVLEALRAAKAGGLGAIALVGANTTEISALAPVVVGVDHQSTARVQEAHLFIYHFWCGMVDEAFSRR